MRTDDARRAALRSWLEEQRPALERADWGAAFRGYPALDLTGEPVPWTPFTGDPAAARIALVTSAGVFVQGRQEPFDAANPLWRSLVSPHPARDAARAPRPGART